MPITFGSLSVLLTVTTPLISVPAKAFAPTLQPLFSVTLAKTWPPKAAVPTVQPLSVSAGAGLPLNTSLPRNAPLPMFVTLLRSTL